MKQYKRVLFVAENGTCRAPMAAGILREYIRDPELVIGARGLVVLFPEPLNQKAEAVMISNGITMENYMSRQLAPEDFNDDTLILPMDEVQREKILDTFPMAKEAHVHVLSVLVGDELETMYPYGGPLQSDGLLYETLCKSLKKLVKLLEEPLANFNTILRLKAVGTGEWNESERQDIRA